MEPKKFMTILVHFLLLPIIASTCSEEEKYNLKMEAEMCYNRELTRLDSVITCDNFDFRNSVCKKALENCYDTNFINSLGDFYLARAMNLKHWIFLSNKLLDKDHSKSVFYFFSPFLLHFCSQHQLRWFHIFYEECQHVKNITKRWPLSRMSFWNCPSVKEYVSSGRRAVFGPVRVCSDHLNQEHNFCVQKHMNILPAKKNSSWRDACKNLQLVNF